jgi:hypothetical protein
MSAAGEDAISPAVKYRCINYAFAADCTLHLEDGTDVCREIKGKWSASRLLNEEEWLAHAEHTLARIVGTLHQHDPIIPSRVERWTFHSWRQW